MTVTTPDQLEALFDQLANTEGKAEIVDGEIVSQGWNEPWSGDAAANVFLQLRHYAKQKNEGAVATTCAIFRVNLPNRQSFSPDAAYFIGTKLAMKHYNGAPVFAVEVRSAGDYGPRAERQLAAKRSDYFAAGTQVVWDVDLLAQDVVRVYRSDSLETPTIYRPGEVAEAEPAVPGWTMPVNELLPEDWQSPFVDEDDEST
jgi:Uma2 family endonuclease